MMGNTDQPQADPGGDNAEPYRRRLVRSVLRPGQRSPTRLLLITKDGREHELVSGAGDAYHALAVRLLHEAGLVDPRHMPECAAHVEMKAATWTQLRQVQDVRLVTNGVACAGPLGCASALSGKPTAWRSLTPDPASLPVVWAYYREGHDLHPTVIENHRGILDLLEDLAAGPFDHSLAALYAASRTRNPAGLPDHELRVGVDGQTRRAALRYMGGTGTWHSAGWRSKRDEVCFYHMRNDTPFPLHSEISLDEAADAVEQFLGSNGRRPENIAWTPVTPPPVIRQSE